MILGSLSKHVKACSVTEFSSALKIHPGTTLKTKQASK